MGLLIFMGRKKYTEDERVKMVSMFVRQTRAIIDSEGIDQVTIRKVAKLCGYNSATLYHYFENLDELITLSCMSYLEEYCRAWAKELKTPRSAYDTYLFTWELYGRYAFKYPQVFNRLFFYMHTKPLRESIEDYYEVFPDQLENISGAINDMLRGGSLVERDFPVLNPLADAGLIRHEDVQLISELAVCHFHSLLEEKCALGDELDNDELILRQSRAVRFLLGNKL